MMLSNFSSLVALPSKVKIDPKDIPPPTEINIPRYQPFAQDDAPPNHADQLSELLKHTSRGMASMSPIGLSAIGVDLILDASPAALLPDPSCAPDYARWNALGVEEARELNQSTRRPLRNGNQSPGCQTYLERLKELSISNQDAFRTVRRIKPPRGQQQARLGNAYEFFRCLEVLTTFWDDPTRPISLPPSPELSTADALPLSPPDGKRESLETGDEDPPSGTRSSSGANMPQEYRYSLISAFIKLVAYDFGCNVSLARLEPRLELSSPRGHPSRKTYIPSGCTFVYQSPTTREAARGGLIYGPLAAVSARNTTSFDKPDLESAQSLDLSREIVAALITAQHRARESKEEVRYGQGQWWTEKKRWGGGPGGPIGREIDKNAVAEKETREIDGESPPAPVAKRPRKTMTMYENYRMMRPPASTWDKKTVYQSIGRQRASDCDDVFVVSSLFHHISILRVRVPDRLLEVLDGAPEPESSRRSWGRVPAWRSPWYDLFDADQRVAAMKLMWGVMAYQMRKDELDDDVKMSG